MSNPLDQVHAATGRSPWTIRTDNVYVDRTKRFIPSHGKRHPREIGQPEVVGSVTHLSVRRDAPASTQNQARFAPQFFEKVVLGRPLARIDDAVVRAYTPELGRPGRPRTSGSDPPDDATTSPAAGESSPPATDAGTVRAPAIAGRTRHRRRMHPSRRLGDDLRRPVSSPLGSPVPSDPAGLAADLDRRHAEPFDRSAAIPRRNPTGSSSVQSA